MINTILATILFSKPVDELLTAESPITVPGKAGHFDFMNVDRKNRYVFACHPGNKSFTVVNLDTKDVKEVDAGVEVNGICADSNGKLVFAAGPGNTLVKFDSSTWTKTGSLALSGPGDCVQYDSKHGVVYVDNDDGTNLWVVDPKEMKLVDTVAIKEAPEYMEFWSKTDKIYQAIKSTSTVQVVNAATRKVEGEWTLGELTSPHGLALDKRANLVFVAGKNGKLVILNATTGKVLNTVEVVKGSDQIAYDSQLKRVYIPSEGKLQVIQIEGENGTVVSTVPVGADCHRVTVDMTTHDVWVAYSDKTNSFVQKFVAKQ
jgi:DNA-binding beta-propeller fold protein YncE